MTKQEIRPNGRGDSKMGRILEDISKWPIEKREEMICSIYQERMGRKLNLKEPKLFTEMLQWMKLYYCNPLVSKIVDKVEFKNYIEKKIGSGYTAELYKVWNTPNQVNLKELEYPCVVKSNCMADGRDLLIIEDINKIDIREKENEIKQKWFDKRLLLTNSFANWYYAVTPCVLIEEYIYEVGDGSAKEFKIYCFNGNPKCIAVPKYRFENGEKKELVTYSMYDTEWNYLKVKHGNWPTVDETQMPKQLKSMLDISETLSKDFPFVRVDFYHTETKLLISEMSFSVSAGFAKYEPVEFEEKMGEWMNIIQNVKEEYIKRF